LPTLVRDPSLPTRVSSTLGNPIYLGSYLIVSMYLSVFFGIQTESLSKRIGYYSLGFIFLIGIFLSGTRGAVVGLIVGTFLAAVTYVVLTKNKKIRIYSFASIIVFLVIAGLLFTFSSKLPHGSTIQRVFKLKDSNTQARLVQWGSAIKGYKDHPIFGVGPENYYVIANQYYNPEIFQYDRSWFDKPHNYILEILVTNGIFGLLSYLGLLGFSILAFYKGYKAGFYGLMEFCVLLAALLVYQVQNLTVFDTVPASLMFYSFMGFAGYIWESSKTAMLPEKKEKILTSYNSPIAFSVLGLSVIVMAYVIYAGNVVPMTIASNVNYGYAYASVDANKADAFFQSAITSPFNFDKDQTASKYSEFAQGYVRGALSGTGDRVLAVKFLGESISYLEDVVKETPNDPILWQRLSNLYLFKSAQAGNQNVVNPQAIDALNKAVALAPQRQENYLAQIQIQLLNGNNAEAEKIFLEMEKTFPTDLSVKSQLAQLYHTEGKDALALQTFQDAIKAGYEVTAAREISWVVDFYITKQDFSQAIIYQEQAVKLDGNNIQQFITLAKLYAQVGRKDEAINLAKEIMQVDKTQQKPMQDLIDSLTPKTTK
jgi:tetratricopeptide (TPR) repeat protein